MSWIEVESKVNVKNLSEARKNIKKIAKFVRIEKKVDDYYSLERGHYPKKSLRLRKKGNNVEVNFKRAISYKKGVWAKEEVEFHVSDINNFFNLLQNFGFEKWLRKEKRTELYKTKDGVSIELNNVKNLGWFIEIEILCDSNNVKDARKRVKEIMKKLSVKKRTLEKKGYTKLLWKKS